MRVTFEQLSPRLQQIAAWLIEDEAPCNLTYAEHPDPAKYTYELWPEGERIKTVYFNDIAVDDEYEEDPDYDHDYGQVEAIKASREAEVWRDEHRLLNRGYSY